MTTEQEKNLTEELHEMLDDNSNYKSSYTGTPVFFSEIAIPKIIALLKAKNISFNPVLFDSVCPNCKFEPMIKVDEKYKCEMCGYDERQTVL